MKSSCFKLALVAAFLTALLTPASRISGQETPPPTPPAAPAKPADQKPEEKKPPAWETTAALGVTLTRGNSKTLLVTGNILSEKKWDHNEMRLGADATYGEDNNTKNAESAHGFAQFNRLFTDRFYGYGRLDALHDAIADVDYRLTLAPGVGYYIIKNTTTSLSGELGPGFIYEKLGGRTHGYATLRIAERFEEKLNDRVKVWESVEFLPEVDRLSNYIINSEIGLDTSLTKKMSLRVFAQDTYRSEPAPDREKNDLKLVTAIAYKF